MRYIKILYIHCMIRHVSFCIVPNIYNVSIFHANLFADKCCSLNILRKTQVIYQQRRISLMNKPFNYVLVLLYAQDCKIAGETSK